MLFGMGVPIRVADGCLAHTPTHTTTDLDDLKKYTFHSAV